MSEVLSWSAPTSFYKHPDCMFICGKILKRLEPFFVHFNENFTEIWEFLTSYFHNSLIPSHESDNSRLWRSLWSYKSTPYRLDNLTNDLCLLGTFNSITTSFEVSIFDPIHEKSQSMIKLTNLQEHMLANGRILFGLLIFCVSKKLGKISLKSFGTLSAVTFSNYIIPGNRYLLILELLIKQLLAPLKRQRGLTLNIKKNNNKWYISDNVNTLKMCVYISFSWLV